MKRLDEVLPSVRIDAATAAEAAEQLRKVSGLNVVIDPAALQSGAHEVNVRTENAPLRVPVKQFAEQLHLCYVVRDGVLYFTDEAAAKSLIGRADRVFATYPPRDPERLGYEAMKKAFVSFTFDATPAADAIDMLHVLGHVSVVVDPAVLGDRKVTLKLDNVSLPLAFSLLAEQLGARWVLANGAVQIVK